MTVCCPNCKSTKAKVIETPEGFLHFQARIILNELHAARQLANKLGHDPAMITAPYLEHLQRLYLP